MKSTLCRMCGHYMRDIVAPNRTFQLTPKKWLLMELTLEWNAQLNPHSISQKPNPWPTFLDESKGETLTPLIFCKWFLEKQQKYWTKRISDLGSNWISRHPKSYKKSEKTIIFQIHDNQLQGCKEHILFQGLTCL
jgi:hypothetical protein